MLINGSCHCRNITYELDWTPEPAEIPARACGCTFCVKHGGVWTSCPAGTLRVRIADQSRVAHYRFGTGTAEFLACRDCGVVPLVTSRIGDNTYAVVNVNTFDDAEATTRLRRSPASFDGESEEVRLARRARNWIGRVEFASGAT